MGCWNKTCGLTQMPIFAGEEVVTFYLVENPFKVEPLASYATGYWSYVPLPFYGKYDDYGFLEMSKGQDWKLQQFKKSFGRYVVKDEPDPTNTTSIDQWTVDADAFDDYEKLKEAIHRRRFMLNVYGEKESCFSFVMFEKKTFDMLAAPYNPEKLSALLQEFVEYAHEQMLQDEAAFVKECGDDQQAAKIAVILRRLNGVNSCVDTFCKKKKIKGWDSVEKWLLHFWTDRSSATDSTGYGIAHFLTDFKYMIENNDPKLNYRELVDGFLASVIMTRLRKLWMPAGHEGSQDELNPDHKVFMKAFKARHSAITHKWDEIDD